MLMNIRIRIGAALPGLFAEHVADDAHRRARDELRDDEAHRRAEPARRATMCAHDARGDGRAPRRAVDLHANRKREVLQRVRDLDPEERLRVARHHRVPHEERDPGDERARRRKLPGALAHHADADRAEHERRRPCRR